MQPANMTCRLLVSPVRCKFFNQTLFYSKMTSKSALVLIVEGNEEMETVIPVDTLRRAGINVTLAGVPNNRVVNCSRDVKIVPDTDLDSAVKQGPFDIIILPGGLGGAKAFCQSAAVGALLKEQETAGRKIAAICASPTVLKTFDIGVGKKVTSHPSVKQEMIDAGKHTYTKDRVVVDGQLITSQGPGTAFEFSIKIVELLVGKEEADKLITAMLLKF